MARRIRTLCPLWLAGATVMAASLVLLSGGEDTAAHEGHDTDMWEFTWNRGSTVTLDEYLFWHYNSYRRKHCAVYDFDSGECAAWVDSGVTRTRYADSCAARPSWVVAAVVSGQAVTPSAPSGATCNRHDSYREGSYKWEFAGHATAYAGDTSSTIRNSIPQPWVRESGTQRCRLPITGIQSAATSTNTDPPGGASTVIRASKAQPSRGSPVRCGWWSGARRHPPDTSASTAPPTTPAGGGSWSGTCSFSFTAGRAYSRELPTHSGGQVSGYSYSGGRPGGMSVTVSPPRIAGTPTGSGTFSGTLTARMSGGTEDASVSCTFRVSGGPTTTTTPRPTRESGWTSACYEKMQLGELLGDRRNPEIPLPWYNGADRIYHSGQLPRGVKRVRIDGEQFLYGQVQQVGTFTGRVTAWRSRARLSTQDCLIVVTGGTWNPSVCEFFLEVGASYDLRMPRLRGVLVDRYYATGGLPPGLSVSPSGVVSGSPTSEGSWTPSWRAVIDGVSTRPSITCTFHVAAPAPPGWSGTCSWTFTVGYSYTRTLPVASGATIHLWTGGVPGGMRMRFVSSGGVWAQQLSGTPATEGLWEGTLAPSRPRPEGVDDLWCSFEVLPGPDADACSLTIPSAEIDRISDEIEWRSDLPMTDAHTAIPGGDSYLFTTGDPGVGGRSPRIWPWWSSDAALTVTDTTGCEWRMVEVLSAARPLFPWYGNDLDVIRLVAPAIHTQWQAMTAAQRAEVEATGRRALRGVGLGTPEEEKWLGSSCQPGDVPETGCVWGIPFPGVWQWSLTVRYRSPADFRQRDLTIAAGATRLWRFADQAGG